MNNRRIPSVWFAAVAALVPLMAWNCGSEAPGAIEGTVVLENRSNHEGVRIELPGTQFRATAAADGSFRIVGLPPGPYTVVMSADGYREHRMEAEVRRGASVSTGLVTLPERPPETGTLGGFATLTGETTHDGVIIMVVGTNLSTTTGATGFYQVRGAPPGAHTILAFKEGWLPASQDTPEVVPGEEIQVPEIQLERPGAEAGPDAGEPVIEGDYAFRGAAFLRGRASHEGIRVELGDAPSRFAVTSATGYFVLDGIDSATRTLVFSYPGYRTETIPAAVPDAATGNRTAGFVTLRREDSFEGVGILQGKALLEGREDHANTIVRLEGVSQSLATDSDGRFMFVGIPAGEYVLTAEHQGFVTQRVENAAVLADQISRVDDISLPATGEAPGEGTGAVAGIAMLEGQADHGGIAAALEGTPFNAITGPGGEFRFEEVPEGVYRVILTRGGYKNAYIEGVPVEAGETTQLEPAVLRPDVEPPYVVDVFPSAQSRRVPIDHYVDVIVRFSERMDPASVKRSVIVEPPVSHDAFFDRESDLSNIDVLHLRLYQDAPMPVMFDTRYTVTVTPDARTPRGVPLEAPFSFSFTTAGPLILRTAPGQGAENFQLGIGNPIWFETNAPVDLSTINRALRIRPKPDAEPMAQTTPSGAGAEVLLYLSLRPGARYRVMIDNNLKTLDGDRFDNTPFSLTFTTMGNEGFNEMDAAGRFGSRRRR